MFPAIVAISPGIGSDSAFRAITNCLRRDFSANQTVQRQLVLSAGDKETGLSASTVRLRDFVRDSAPPNWRMLLVDGTGLGHTDTPFSTIPAGIRFVQAAAMWEMPAAVGDSVRAAQGDEAARRVAQFYKSLSARVGYMVGPSANWLLTDACMRDGNTDCARRSLESVLRIVERMDFFDESGRAMEQKLIKENLQRLPAKP